jgi:hypothetical protein
MADERRLGCAEAYRGREQAGDDSEEARGLGEAVAFALPSVAAEQLVLQGL